LVEKSTWLPRYPQGWEVLFMQDDARVAGWTFRRLHERYIQGFAVLFLFSVILAVILPHWISWLFCVLTGFVFGIVIYFFRDPERVLERDPQLFYSPADGVVSDITTVPLPEISGSDFLRIGIFMSVVDVHVQRSPITGVVEFVSHQPGKFHPAYDPAAPVENDQIIMGIKTETGLILVKQIAGILARKCVNYAKPGEEISAGQRYGLIKFGSRVELFVPVDLKVLVAVEDRVIAGITPIVEISNV
jgi:phosphatidylserine decarboxylase